MKLEHFLTPYKKINSKWIKDLNIRTENIKLLEENIGRILYDINHSKTLYDPHPRIMEIKTKINKWDRENGTATCKRIKLEHFLTPYIKINSKWIKDLNVRPENLKLLEENIGRTLDHINQSKILYDPPPRLTEIKTKVNKWDLIKLKSFCTAKETIIKV